MIANVIALIMVWNAIGLMLSKGYANPVHRTQIPSGQHSVQASLSLMRGDSWEDEDGPASDVALPQSMIWHIYRSNG